MSKKKLSYEWRRINYFFGLYDQEGAAKHLWEMLKLALNNGEVEAESRDRSNMIFLYEYTKGLYENIYTLLHKQKAKIGNKDS